MTKRSGDPKLTSLPGLRQENLGKLTVERELREAHKRENQARRRGSQRLLLRLPPRGVEPQISRSNLVLRRRAPPGGEEPQFTRGTREHPK